MRSVTLRSLRMPVTADNSRVPAHVQGTSALAGRRPSRYAPPPRRGGHGDHLPADHGVGGGRGAAAGVRSRGCGGGRGGDPVRPVGPRTRAMDGGPARRHLPGDARAHDGADGHPRHGLRRVARHRARREERPRRLHERRVSGQWRPDVHDAVREDLPGELTGGGARVGGGGISAPAPAPLGGAARSPVACGAVEGCWTEPGPFVHNGKHYKPRYVNPWPTPPQKPHPPIWIPGAGSYETMDFVARRRWTYMGIPY